MTPPVRYLALLLPILAVACATPPPPPPPAPVAEAPPPPPPPPNHDAAAQEAACTADFARRVRVAPAAVHIRSRTASPAGNAIFHLSAARHRGICHVDAANHVTRLHVTR